MKKYVLALVMLLTTLCVIYAQNSNDEKWQEHKQKVIQKMNEDKDATHYIAYLDSIVSLDKVQIKDIEKSYRDFHKSKKAIYKQDLNKKATRTKIIDEHALLIKQVEDYLNSYQNQLMADYKAKKRTEIEKRRDAALTKKQ